MSDAGRKPREWSFYVKDMIEFARKVQAFTEGMDQVALSASRLPMMLRCGIWNSSEKRQSMSRSLSAKPTRKSPGRKS